MLIDELDNSCKLEKIEWTSLPGERWRAAGANARLGVHGKKVKVVLARISAGDVQGFGWAMLSPEIAKNFLDVPLREMFYREEPLRVLPEYRLLEFPLLDWWGQVNRRPVYQLLKASAGLRNSGLNQAEELSVPCYDTSLYFDDLELQDEKAAVALMQSEALEGWARGHRAFKIKVGRGARHMPLAEGMQRDVAIVNAIRQAVGPTATLMADANNGYNLNLTRQFLSLTRAARLFWLEEPFHEDNILLEDLQEWLTRENLATLIADGEGQADPRLLEWAKAGLVDVIQYDLREYGFGRWLELGALLDAAKVKSGPHNYGGLYGNYASAHLAPAIANFLYVEWDGREARGLDTSSYEIREGRLIVPQRPGFGLGLDEAYFSQRVKEEGWQISQ
ncbi:MAG TPA: enolase C-terminal domain-like protein [Chloroflexia bacterium]|nr:enolase C-terminal domain-like protein [Chloroflexia bacterium]